MARKITAKGENIKIPKYVQNLKMPKYMAEKSKAEQTKYKNEYIELFKQYKQLAKTADQRLVRLHSYEHDKFYRGITSYAYAGAMESIRNWSGKGATRFNTKAPEDLRALKAKINDIKNFLEKPTSTKEGVKKYYEKRTETINKNLPGKGSLTWQEVANFFEFATNKIKDMQPGSESVLIAIDNIKKYEITKENALSLLGAIKDVIGKVIYTSQLSEEQKKEYKKLYEDQFNKEKFGDLEGELTDFEIGNILYMLNEEGIDFNTLQKGV